MTTEVDVWRKVTHVHCFSCNTDTRVTDFGFFLTSEDDLDDAYDEVDCCDDPSLEALIISEKPVFNNEEVDGDAHVAANPRMGIYSEAWQYHVGDDLIESLEGN